MVKKGFLENCVLVKGRGWLGWVVVICFRSMDGQHSSAETGRLRGLMDGEGFFIPLYS